jgi:hypothetical protein
MKVVIGVSSQPHKIRLTPMDNNHIVMVDLDLPEA